MKTILVPTDGSAAAEKALQVAFDLAEARDGVVKIVHVLLSDKEPGELLRLPDIEADDALTARLTELAKGPERERSVEEIMRKPDMPARPVPEEVLREIGNRVLERARSQAEERGISASVLPAADGKAAPAISALAEEVNADMVVMGMRGLRSIDAFTYGSVSQQVCGTVSCTCIAVH
jgi:nucleotide-binding universal stress UspA family protein